MTSKEYRNVTIGIIAAWCAFAIAASAAHVFKSDVASPPIALGLAAGIPLVAFGIWYGVSAGFRNFLLSLDPRALTIVQSWRFAGIAFVAMFAYGLLPGAFANPAGWGDILIGLTAPWVALKLAEPGRKGAFITWNLLGMLDLVNAVAIGTTMRLIAPQGISTEAMTVWPLSIVPTFLVPLFFILHVIVIAQARRWPARATAAGREQVAATAA